jgi:phage-related minor tail protein
MNDPFSSTADSGDMNVTVKTDFAGFRTEMLEATRLGKQFSSSLATAFDGLVLKGRGLTDVVRTLGQALSQAALKAAFKPLEDAIGSGLSSLVAGGLSGGVGFGFAHGGVFQSGVPVPFARGGVIASPISFPLGGGQHGIAGERGAEAIMPLARGPDGRLGVVSAGGGGGVQVNVSIATPDVEGFQRAESQISAALARAVARGQRNL